MAVIGIDARELVPGVEKAGIGTYVYELVEGLEAHSTWGLVLFTNKQLPGYQDRHHVVVFNGPSLWWHVRVAWYVWTQKVDMYHSPHSILVPLLLGKRSILSVHDITALLFPEKHTKKVRWLYSLFFRSALRRTRSIIVPSHQTESDLLVMDTHLQNKISVVPYAISDPHIEWNPQLRDPYVLFVGTLEPRKNLMFLINLYSELLQVHIDFPRLVIVGKKGWDYEGLFDRVDELGLERKVVFVGYVTEKEKWQWYAGAGAMVYPSLYEGFGFPMLEAMQVGVPVIASDRSSIPEVAGDAAVLLDPEDGEAWKGAIVEVLSDSTYAKKISEAGKKQAEKFRAKEFFKKMETVYNNAIN